MAHTGIIFLRHTQQCYFYNMIELRGDQGANTESFYAFLIDANFKTRIFLQKFSKIMRD